MLIYIVPVVIMILIFVNWFLSEKLYKEPSHLSYYENVTSFELGKEKNITADPHYIVRISILTGILIGLYMAYSAIFPMIWVAEFLVLIIVFVLYLMELTRSIHLNTTTLTLSRFLSKKKEIDVRDISGMYIYSFNKKFLKQHAYTTKLVVVQKNGKKTKFTLSSLDNRAVLNMMKENFGVNSNKMFIANKS